MKVWFRFLAGRVRVCSSSWCVDWHRLGGRLAFIFGSAFLSWSGGMVHSRWHIDSAVALHEVRHFQHATSAILFAFIRLMALAAHSFWLFYRCFYICTWLCNRLYTTFCSISLLSFCIYTICFGKVLAIWADPCFCVVLERCTRVCGVCMQRVRRMLLKHLRCCPILCFDLIVKAWLHLCVLRCRRVDSILGILLYEGSKQWSSVWLAWVLFFAKPPCLWFDVW